MYSDLIFLVLSQYQIIILFLLGLIIIKEHNNRQKVNIVQKKKK